MVADSAFVGEVAVCIAVDCVTVVLVDPAVCGDDVRSIVADNCDIARNFFQTET